MNIRKPWFAIVFLNAALFACTGGEQQVPESTAPVASEAAEPAEEAPQLTGDALASILQDEGVFLLDVRNPEELTEYGTVEGYVNIPIDQLADRLGELPKDQPILTA